MCVYMSECVCVCVCALAHDDLGSPADGIIADTVAGVEGDATAAPPSLPPFLSLTVTFRERRAVML
jgi:hypothetical protein